jgi:hypothetical protein
LWLQRNSHNAFWHLKIEGKFVTWLLIKITTTRSGIMKTPQRVVIVSFYSHGVM